MLFRLFESLVNPFPIQEPETPPKEFWAFCRHYTKGTELFLVIMAILTASIAIMEVSLFGFLGQIVDWLGAKGDDRLSLLQEPKLVFMGFILVIALPLCVFVHSLIMHQTLLGNYPMMIRWQAHRYLLGQSLGFYQNEFAGRIATKVMQTALAVRETVMKLLDVLLYVAVYFTGVVVLAIALDWRMAVPFILWLTGYILLLAFYLPKLGEASRKQADARSEMTGRLVDTYTNISTVKLFSHSNREAEYARSGMESFLSTVYPQMRLATSLGTWVYICNTLLVLCVLSISFWLWGVHLITAGAIAAAVSLALRINGMSQWIMWEVSAIFENMGTARDGLNTLSVPRLVQDKPNAKNLQLINTDIEYKNIIFSYNAEKNIINNFSLKIKPGEKIGLVGRSGSGKSTLVNLLMRFYDINAGEILVGGNNISDLEQESLRLHIGMVTQDTSLLHRSIRDNLLYGNPKATESEMIEAAKKAEAHDFIMSLSDSHGNSGYDAQVGERGVKLSGGQRQRIAIARVLIKNAPFLILDEATSALDSEVEAIIQNNLTQLMEGKTVIAIAHRLSTIAALDRLVVIDNGQIIEQGTHAELLQKRGIYAQLWDRQSGGFLGEL